MKTIGLKLWPIKTISHFGWKKKKGKLLGEMADSRLGQEMYKLSLEHFVPPGKKEGINDCWACSKRS